MFCYIKSTSHYFIHYAGLLNPKQLPTGHISESKRLHIPTLKTFSQVNQLGHIRCSQQKKMYNNQFQHTKWTVSLTNREDSRNSFNDF